MKLTRILIAALALAVATPVVHAQLLGEPPIARKQKKEKQRGADLEWMWQYSPYAANPEGREHELIQDPEFPHFLEEYFTAPQAFWGPNPTDPKAPTHKSLPQTVYDFLAIPGSVLADEERYITVTGAVFHMRTSRGLVFADLNSPHPLVVFAAIDWIRDSRPLADPDAEYTLWIFPNQPPGPPSAPTNLPPPLLKSLTRWMAKPVPGTDFPQKITHAILVDADGTPHQIPVPAGTVASDEAKPLPKRQP